MKLLITAFVLALVGVGIFVGQDYYNETAHNGCVVTKTDRAKNSDGGSDARVYTKNCGTFQVKDSLWKGKFRSGDTYGAIEEGHTYNFTTIGWRNGFLSMFPNIIKVTQVS